jgi:glycosyltransferase involved in cell wall biosynthesis
MLVLNPCVNDSRVIRAAETVAREGFEVTILAKAGQGVPRAETINGVEYRRFGAVPQLQGSAVFAAKKSADADGDGGIPPAQTLLNRIARNRVLWIACSLVLAVAAMRVFLPTFGSPDRLLVRDLVLIGLIGAFGFAYRVGMMLIIGSAATFFRALGGPLQARFLFADALSKLRPDIIHAHDFATLPVGARAAGEMGAVCIYDSHELEIHRNVKRNWFERWLCERMERKHIRRVAAVITVCDSIADYLRDHYRIARPVVVMNAPEASEPKPGKPDIRHQLGLAADVPLALYVGKVTVGRGIENLVRAMPQLPGYHVAFLGGVHPPTVDAAEVIARKLGVAERLHMLPPIPPSEVLSYIQTADVSVVPIQNVCLSYYYCLPNKLTESAFAGLPVVVSDFPELRRFVEAAGTGLVMDEKDPKDIARAVKQAYAQRDALKPDAARRKIIEDIYGWEIQRKRLTELYGEVAARLKPLRSDARVPA